MEMNKIHHYSFIALMEPFQKPSQIEEYKSKLGFDNAIANYSGKIWYFWRRE